VAFESAIPGAETKKATISPESFQSPSRFRSMNRQIWFAVLSITRRSPVLENGTPWGTCAGEKPDPERMRLRLNKRADDERDERDMGWTTPSGVVGGAEPQAAVFPRTHRMNVGGADQFGAVRAVGQLGALSAFRSAGLLPGRRTERPAPGGNWPESPASDAP
jgi:hypothetical protein